MLTLIKVKARIIVGDLALVGQEDPDLLTQVLEQVVRGTPVAVIQATSNRVVAIRVGRQQQPIL
jgi:hypothetical protein